MGRSLKAGSAKPGDLAPGAGAGPIALVPSAILCLCLAISIAATFVGESRGFVLKSDGLSYYLYLRSFFFDRDLDFRNELEAIGRTPNGIDPNARTETGLIGDPFSVGPAILWSPFFVCAHALTKAGNALFGTHVPEDGFSWPYAAAIELASVLYAFFGMLLTIRFCERYFDRQTAHLAVLALFLSSPLIYYSTVMATMSHSMSVFAVSLTLVLWARYDPDPTPARAFGLGLAVGLVSIVRWQDVLALSFLAVAGWRTFLRPSRLLALAAGFAVFPIPQLLAWRAVYGRVLLVPQGGDFMFSSFHPLAVLFSWNHGLLTWHPSIALAIGGLIAFRSRSKKVSLGALALVLLFILANASVSEWWAGKSFGARRFLSLFPFLALGLSGTIEWAKAAGLARILYAVLALLIVWNLTLLALYQLGIVPQVGG